MPFRVYSNRVRLVFLLVLVSVVLSGIYVARSNFVRIRQVFADLPPDASGHAGNIDSNNSNTGTQGQMLVTPSRQMSGEFHDSTSHIASPKASTHSNNSRYAVFRSRESSLDTANASDWSLNKVSHNYNYSSPYEGFYSDIKRFIQKNHTFPWHLISKTELYSGTGVIEYTSRYALKGVRQITVTMLY